MTCQKAVAYLRVSTFDQTLGPEAQRAAIEAYCAREGLELVGVYEDLGVSGAAPLDKRPGLMDALMAMGKGMMLVVSRRDRLARDTLTALLVEEMARKKGAAIVSADGAGNGDNPEAKLLRGMLDLIATYERAIIAARIRAALGVKRGRGEAVGHAPYGYQAGPGGALEPHEGEQAVIAAARAARARGLPLRAVADELESLGFRSRKGGRLGAPQVGKMLSGAE
jgi:site-specific DNA recombinase